MRIDRVARRSIRCGSTASAPFIVVALTHLAGRTQDGRFSHRRRCDEPAEFREGAADGAPGARLYEDIAERRGFYRSGHHWNLARVGSELAEQLVLRAATDHMYDAHVDAAELGGLRGPLCGMRSRGYR